MSALIVVQDGSDSPGAPGVVELHLGDVWGLFYEVQTVDINLECWECCDTWGDTYTCYLCGPTVPYCDDCTAVCDDCGQTYCPSHQAESLSDDDNQWDDGPWLCERCEPEATPVEEYASIMHEGF